MTINEVIAGINDFSDDAVIYAKKHDGKFVGSSEIILLDLTKPEQELQTSEIANKYCPGFDYF